MKKFYSQLFIFISICLFQAQATATDAKTKLEKYLNDTSSFEAVFEQSLITEATNKLEEVSQGKFYLSRPGKFRWDYSQPYEQSIIADGINIWIYDKDLEQVTVKEMSEIMADSPALLLSNEVAISEEFVVSTIPNRAKSPEQEWFRLKPKSEDKQFVDIRLAFEKGDLQEMELRDNFGQLTKIIFTKQKHNKPIDQKIYKFTPPEGVDILDASTRE